jgi:carotenoid cleavage dioxygenase
MTSLVETAIRGTINKGINTISSFSREHASNKAGPHPYLTGIHAPMKQEFTIESPAVTGFIPAELDGLYVRIGPNPIGNPNPARYHWFAGDGMVHGVRISGGEALWYRNRWVRTTSVSRILDEPAAPGPRLADRQVNTNIIGQAGKFWALVEAGATPVELDGMLNTVAHNPFGGTLKTAFSAHPHRDPATGELHAICYDATDMTRVHHVVVSADGKVRREEPIAVNHGPSIHDCAITARFVLVFDLPVTFSMPAMLAGYEFPYRWNPEHQARIGLLPREGRGDEIIWCNVEPCYIYHTANAYDLDDGRVVADVIVHDRNSYRDYRGPDGEDVRFERWTIDPATGAVVREVIDPTPQEFTRFDERLTGLPYRYAYALQVPVDSAAGVIGDTRLLKHDLAARTHEVHDFGPNRFPGEFVFIPRDAGAAEDEGWLMGFVVDMNSETTELVILDAQTFRAAPVATINLPHRIPPGFHGNWVPAL